MSDLTSQQQRVAGALRRSRLSRGGILILGVIVIPFMLTVVLNSYGPLTEESAIHMAFATVSRQSIAILSGIAVVVVMTLTRHPDVKQIALGMVAEVRGDHHMNDADLEYRRS